MLKKRVYQKLIMGLTVGMLTIQCCPVTVFGAADDYSARLSNGLKGIYNGVDRYVEKKIGNFKAKLNSEQREIGENYHLLKAGINAGSLKLTGALMAPLNNYLVQKHNFYTANNTQNGLNNSELSKLRKDSAINLTDEEYLMLSTFAYANIMNETESDTIFQNKTIKQIDQFLDNTTKNIGYGSIKDSEHRDNLDKMANNSKLANLTLKDFEDQNGKGGFVGYAFEVPNLANSTLFAFRGSEGSRSGNSMVGILQMLDELTTEDWIDNYLTGFRSESKQNEVARKFVAKNAEGGQNYVTGHSKGAALAAAACAFYNNCTGVAYDGYGIGQAISDEERQRLKNSGFVNICSYKDPLSAMLYHPEKRAYIADIPHYERYQNGSVVQVADANGSLVNKTITGSIAGHYVQAKKFDSEGNAVLAGQRASSSSKNENLTHLLYLGNKATYEPLGFVVEGIDKFKKTDFSVKKKATAFLEGLKKRLGN